jgi:hypothetical protein
VQPVWLQRLLDRFAILTAGLCMLHCLAMPLLLVLIPVLASTTMAENSFHRTMLLFVLPASSIALLIGCRRHKDLRVLALGLSGLAQIVAAAYFGHDWLGETGEKAITVVGSALLAAGHLRNYRLCRCAPGST